MESEIALPMSETPAAAEKSAKAAPRAVAPGRRENEDALKLPSLENKARPSSFNLSID